MERGNEIIVSRLLRKVTGEFYTYGRGAVLEMLYYLTRGRSVELT